MSSPTDAESPDAAATPSTERLLAIARELLKSWEIRGELASIKVRNSRARPIAEYPMLHGLASHCHRVASAALRLIEDGLVLEAVPLIRTAYECAITAQWIAQTPDAFAAVSQRAVRTHDAYLRTVESAGLRSRLDDEQPDPHPEAVEAIRSMETSATGGASNFEQLCMDLRPVGQQGYALYRIMSSLSHATVASADRYMAFDDGPGLGLTLMLEPRQPDTTSWLGILLSAMIWAGRAVDFREKEHTRRNQLRRLAREIGTVDVLQPSEQARLRQQQAERERRISRRQARRSPSP